MNHKIKIIAVLALLLAAGLFGVFSLKRDEGSILLSEAEEKEDTEASPEEGNSVTMPDDEPSGNETVPVPEKTKTPEPSPVLVHVCGQVHLPGVYALPPESRIFEAVEKAGGFTEEADEDSLNLAGKLSDGAKIYVPARGESEAGHRSEGLDDEPERQSLSETGGTVNINTASKEELMSLSGIGASKAEAIIAYRQGSGPFQTPSDIMKVKGIGEGMYQKIKDRITTG